jgi:Family of unknown function (DUF6847)
MKLGEALTLRSQLLARIAQIRERLKASALVQEGESPPEDPNALLQEFESMAEELQGLIASINRTNLSTELASGETLTAALARRDVLALRHAVVRQVAEVAGERQQRYGRAEIRILPTVDVGELRRQADELARERRELDTAIQETNWTTELKD